VPRLGVYPGTFNPPTKAHLAVADAARRQRSLDRIDLALSRRPINKEHVEVPTFEDRVMVLQAVARRVGWLGVVVTEATLIVDIAAGYDVVLMGADKWAQVNDVQYYVDASHRDEALARLPEIALAPRDAVPHLTIPDGIHIPTSMELDVPPQYRSVSSSAVRSGRTEWMLPEAREFDRATGAWSDPHRYQRQRRP
jgi:phosphopantetheine adenylyltransferase